jgi:crotonobetainyl-CoA:carnitine CoA-transferase CaiB-like acyl-CoA transferase
MAASVAPADHPDLLAVSSSGFGQDGPHADYRAYAYNLQASGALGYLTRNQAGENAEIDIAWADLISAYALATIIAAWAVGPAGNAGAGIDFSMTDLVVSHFNEYLAAASLERHDDEVDRANDLAPFAPHGVYATTDGWLAIAVDGDEEYQRLVAYFGHPSLHDHRFDTSQGRLEHLRVLDERLARVVSRHSSEFLVERLQALGIAAERVVGAADLITDAQLEARGFFARVEHPEWGSRPIVGIPWRPYDFSPLALAPPPLLGVKLTVD